MKQIVSPNNQPKRHNISDMDSSLKILEVLCTKTAMRLGMIRRKNEGMWHNWCTYDSYRNHVNIGELENYTTLFSHVRKGLDPVFIKDIDHCENCEWKQILRDFGLKSYISYPILDDNRSIIGHLSFMDKQPVHFDKNKLEALLPILGSLIAIDFRSVSKVRRIQKLLTDEREHGKKREIIWATLAHDIKNPLSAIRLVSQCLRDKIGDHKLSNMANTILESCQRVKETVDDILDFSAIKFSDGLVGTRELVDIHRLLQQILREYHSQSDQLKIVKMDVPFPIMCNKNKMGRAFANLISNALRHGKQGRDIWIESCIRDDNFIFSVENDTDPISASVLDRLFVPFVRGANSTGIGLGLYITQEIAKMHGGKTETSVRKGKLAIRMVIPVKQSPAEDTERRGNH